MKILVIGASGTIVVLASKYGPAWEGSNRSGPLLRNARPRRRVLQTKPIPMRLGYCCAVAATPLQAWN
jgi:hypothetical protein